MNKQDGPSNALPTDQIYNPFTVSWIQALAAAATNPVARTIKPKIDLVNALSRSQLDADRPAAAQQLWEYADSEGLKDLLCFLPVFETKWVFDTDDVFLYERRDAEQTTAESGMSFERWQQTLGLTPMEVGLHAEVFSGDWASLVRSEAVRLQKSFSMSAIAQATTLKLPCTARWNKTAWSVQFDQVDWVVVDYSDLPHVPRPNYQQMEERLTWMLANASDVLVAKKATRYEFRPVRAPWFDCVESLKPLHEMLCQNSNNFSPWLTRTWSCVWPVIYREQNVLRGRADIDRVRSELKACLDAQPRLCVWMFMFAKLVCQTQISTGLGFCADYRG